MTQPGRTLEEIYRPIANDLAKVEKAFKTQLQGYDHFSEEVLSFLLGDPGKRMRPALVLLTAGLKGRAIGPLAIQIATAVELLHTATLLHDDVLDEALLRRRKERINSRWGNEIPVVVGDYIYAKAFLLISHMKMPGAFGLLSETAKVMCIGELAQLVKRFDFALLEKEYFRMIEFKTASLIQRSCELGARVACASTGVIRHAAEYGRQFGIGFQIVDDCLDLVGEESRVGKSLGTDIQKGKPTLPLIYLLQRLPNKDQARLKEVMRESQDGEAVKEVRRLVLHYGTLEASLRCAKGYFEKAKARALGLPRGETKDSLLDLADYTLRRTH